jgi:cell division protein FtsA
MLTRHTLITSVDIGAATTTAVIAEADNHGYVELLGHGQSPTIGFSDDVVNDIRELGASIAASVEAAEDMAQQRAGSLLVAVGGEHVRILQSRGGIPLHQTGRNSGRLINRQDIKRAIDNAGAVPMPNDLKVLHVLPITYHVDGQKFSNPEGLSGTRLDADVLIVAARASALNSLSRAAEYGDYRIKDFYYRPLATGRSVLSNEEIDQGACLIDVGGRHTDVAVFKDGKMLHAATLAIGGEDITFDTRSLLGVSQAEAEKIKLRFGHCNSNLQDDPEFQITGGSDGELWRTVRKSELGHDVIQPRAEEIIEEALTAICGLTENGQLPAGAVLTGGAAQLDGFRDLAATIFPIPVVEGVNVGLENIDELSGRADHSTALGMVLLDVEQKLSRREDVLDNPLSRWCGRMVRKIHTVM